MKNLMFSEAVQMSGTSLFNALTTNTYMVTFQKVISLTLVTPLLLMWRINI